MVAWPRALETRRASAAREATADFIVAVEWTGGNGGGREVSYGEGESGG